MGFLSKKELLQKRPPKVQKVDMGGDDFVFVKQMTGRERDAFESLIIEKTTVDGKVVYNQVLDAFRARLAVCSLCDEAGELLFSLADVDQLNESLSAAQLQAIVEASQELNKISTEAKATAEKN